MVRDIQRPPKIEAMESRRLFTVLLPGGSASLNGTTLAARPELAGAVIYQHSSPISVSAHGSILFTGNLIVQVVREDAAGTLDFYQSIQSSGGGGALNTIDEDGFSQFSTDVDYRTDIPAGAYAAPFWANRSGSNSRTSIDFQFDSLLPQGTQTAFYFVKTNATQFDLKGLTQISSSGGGSARLQKGSFSGKVSLATPEPTGVAAAPVVTSIAAVASDTWSSTVIEELLA